MSSSEPIGPNSRRRKPLKVPDLKLRLIEAKKSEKWFVPEMDETWQSIVSLFWDENIYNVVEYISWQPFESEQVEVHEIIVYRNVQDYDNLELYDMKPYRVLVALFYSEEFNLYQGVVIGWKEDELIAEEYILN